MKKNIFIAMIFCCLYAASTSQTEEIKLDYSSLLQPVTMTESSRLVMAQNDRGGKFLDMSQSAKDQREISMKKAMLLTMLFPGAGQYYADSKFKGQVFMGVEAAIWTGFIAYRVYGGWKKDSYQDFAAAHAGVDNSGKDEEFYDWVGFYESREQFNQLGRLYYPDRPYLPDNSSYDWQWDSDENRVYFKEMKDDSKRAFRNSTFMIGLAIANRIIAGIDTYRTVKSAQAKLKSLTQVGDYKFTLSPKILGDNPSIKLTVSRKFY
jgi:hypothetical protein